MNNMAEKKPRLLARWIEDHIDYPHADYCLIWPFGRGNSGYGIFHEDGKTHYAHRYICERKHGAPPTTKHQAAHSCNQGHMGCVNPHHLSWKTAGENQRDRGTDPRPRTKLTPDQILEIRSVFGIESSADTAARFNVTEATIRQIQYGKTWRTDRKWQRRLTDDEVNDIRGRQNESASELAKEYKTSHACIWRIQRGRTYRSVPARPPISAL